MASPEDPARTGFICQPSAVSYKIRRFAALDTSSLGPDLRAAGHYVVKPVTRANLLGVILKALGDGPQRLIPSAGVPPATAGRSLHILLTEDNRVNQKVAARLLEKHGHSVQVTSNGLQALAALTCDKFDLILMDVQMPVMNGYDATEAIRARERGTDQHIPIVALTAHAMKGDREVCLKAGMDDYLCKPIHPRELLAVLERCRPRVSATYTINKDAPGNPPVGPPGSDPSPALDCPSR